MTNGYYNIKPIEVVVGLNAKTAVNATFTTSYTPFQTSMPFTWAIYDAEGFTLYMGQGVVSEEQLAGWGDSDVYIVNTMASIAGLEVIW